MSFECLKAGAKWRVSWVFVALAVPIGALLGAHLLSPVINGPIVYLRDTHVLSPSVQPNEPLRLLIRAAVKPSMRCTGYVVREFYKIVVIDGRVMREKWRHNIGAPPIPLDNETEYVLDVPLPDNIMPGPWQLHGRTTLDCGVLFGGVSYYDTPFLDFTVENP